MYEVLNVSTWLIFKYDQSGGFFLGVRLRQLLFGPQHLIMYIWGDFGRILKPEHTHIATQLLHLDVF